MPGYIFIFHDPRLQLDLFTRDPGYREHPTSMVDAEIADAVAFQARPTVPPVNGSLGFLQRSDGTGPVRVGEEIVDELRGREKRGEFDEYATLGRFHVPRWVRLKRIVEAVRGPFVGRRGPILKVVNKDTLRIRITEANTSYPVDQPIAWLSPI